MRDDDRVFRQDAYTPNARIVTIGSVMDYRNPQTQIELIRDLDKQFGMTIPQFCRLHHKGANSYLPTRTFEDHFRYCAQVKQFNEGPGNADTGRRLHICFVALQAGATWERAIDAALLAIPLGKE